jgi:hypothetical protein
VRKWQVLIASNPSTYTLDRALFSRQGSFPLHTAQVAGLDRIEPIYIHAYTHPYLQTHTLTYLHAHILTYTHTPLHTYTHPYLHTHTLTYLMSANLTLKRQASIATNPCDVH